MQQSAAADGKDQRPASGQRLQHLGGDGLIAVGPERVEVRVDEVAAALLGDLGRVAQQVAAAAVDLDELDAERRSFSSLARAIVCGTTPIIAKPNALAPTAAPRAVLPIDGTTSGRVRPSRLRWSSRWVAPRILKQPDGARNSHLA